MDKKLLLALTFALAVSGCSRSPNELSSAPSSPGGDQAPSPSAAAVKSFASPTYPLVWDDPPAWTRRKPKTDSRAAEYLVPRAPGDLEDAECTVFTFGPQQGGTPEQNMDRWTGQFTDQTEKPSRAERPGGQGGGLLPVKRVEVAGTYTPMRLPGESGPPEPKHGYRLIGAIVQAPSGEWFFKLTGPDATVKAAAHDLEHILSTARPRG
jgi:hypothetical protein